MPLTLALTLHVYAIDILRHALIDAAGLFRRYAPYAFDAAIA